MQAIREFLDQPALAVVGASRTGKKFGNSAIRELKANGYRVFPVHPDASSIEGLPCVSSLAALPEPVGGLLLVVPRLQSERLIPEAARAGIRRIWMQQGSSSAVAVAACAEHGIAAIHGECILMFLRKGPKIHGFHRWLRKVFGRMPGG